MPDTNNTHPIHPSDIEDAEHAAELLHESWRKARVQQDGSYTPLFEPTRDEQWISLHKAGTVDVANTRFADLPGDIQVRFRK